jgi:hypothetical protein
MAGSLPVPDQIRLRSDGSIEIAQSDLGELGRELAEIGGGSYVIDEPPASFGGPDLPPGMTVEQLAALADDMGTVDRETYMRLFRDRFVPEPPPGFEDDRYIVMYRPPRSTRRRPIVAEVLTIMLPWAGGYAASKAADAAIAWARRRWRRDKGQGSPRKRIVTIYGPNDEVLRHVSIDEPDGTPKDLPR